MILSSVVVCMAAMSYAAVPLYRLFCQTTGYGGTPLVAKAAPDVVLDRTIEVRLDANVAPDLPWRFAPKQNSVTVRLGETVLVHYQATNIGTTTTRGTASYNVAPDSTGAYFNKIECFCFTEQKLEPGQTVDMPVTFFVDPALAGDRDTNRLPVITLSYTFHAMDKPSANAAARGAGEKS
jgi:cytochrome c oxidase assembly protein subunit 11